jgi:hypothetical protein
MLPHFGHGCPDLAGMRANMAQVPLTFHEHRATLAQTTPAEAKMARFGETLEGQFIRPRLIDPTITGASTTERLLVSGLLVRRLTTTNVTTAGAATLTAAAVLGGRITRDPAGSNRTDVLPTGTLLDDEDTSLATGDAFTFVLDNTADAAETITLDMGTGLTNRGSAITIAQNTSAVLQFVKTGTATYNVYRLA